MNKLTLYLCIITLLLVGYIWWQQSRITRLKNENFRVESNFKNSQFKIDSISTKDGEKAYTINQLITNKDELLETNKSLYEAIDNMKLKIKDLESSTRIEYKYIFQKDTVFLQPDNPEDPNNNRYKANFSDKYIDFNTVVVIKTPKPFLENINFQLKDTLTTACKFITKQKWFLFIPCGRKVVGTEIYIKSENPYFKLDKVETYQFINSRNKKKFN